MKNYIKLFGTIALVAVVVFSMAACKKSGNSSGSSDATPEASPSISSGSDNSVDSLLAEYEKFVDEYTSNKEKANDGDSSAAAEVERLQFTATEWTTRLLGFSDDNLTPEQWSKLLELNQRYASAMSK